MEFIDVVIENRLASANLVFRNSFGITIEDTEYSDSTLAEICYNLGQGLAQLSTADFTVVGARVYKMAYDTNVQKPLQWERIGTLLQEELSYTGGRTALPATNMPYGFGAYYRQVDSRITGRSGKLILKVGFWEEMLKARYTKWDIESGSVGTTQYNTAFTSVTGVTGKWGMFFATGTNVLGSRMVNYHKGSNEPSVVKSLKFQQVQKYRIPRPSVD